MNELDYPDRHHVRSALGWIELGAFDEAGADLARVSEDQQSHPAVLDAWWHLHAAQNDWAAAAEISRRLIVQLPDLAQPWIHQSYALHELDRTQDALDELLKIVERFPDVGVIPYNIACYHCRLGNLIEARLWLKRAIKTQGRRETLAMAREDPDLEPLRRDLEKL